MYQYVLTIQNVTYDVSSLVNSKNTTIKKPLTTKEFKSATGTASFSLIPTADITYYNQVLQAILNARDNLNSTDCLVEIYDSTPTCIFRGYLDESSLALASSKHHEVLNLTAKDKTILLDNKITQNVYYEGSTRAFWVTKLIEYSGATITGVDTTAMSNSNTISNYCISDDSNKTYREIIDTVLFYYPAMVLVYEPSTDKFVVKSTKFTLVDGTTYRQVHYEINQKLNTNAGIYDYDGVLVSYPTISTRENQNIYTEDITPRVGEADTYDASSTYSLGDYVTYDSKLYRANRNITVPEQFIASHWTVASTTTIVGKQIRPNEYFPTDGDIQATMQEFTAEGLDRAYITKQSRLKNDDIALLYAKNCAYQQIADVDLTPAPNLPNISYDGIKYYPTKAWVLLRNATSSTVNLQAFSIVGTAVYKSANNKITAPYDSTNHQALCVKPEEIDTETIYNETDAKNFANWIFNAHKYSNTTSTWTEPTLTSYLGEIVNIVHPQTGIAIPHAVIQIDNIYLAHNVRQYKVTALCIDSYQTWVSTDYNKSTDMPSIGNVANASKVLVSTREFAISSNSSQAPTTGWTTNRASLTPTLASPYIWAGETVTYGDGTIKTSNPYVLEVYTTSETMLFSMVVSPSNFIRDLRDHSTYNSQEIIITKEGYSASLIPTVEYSVDGGSTWVAISPDANNKYFLNNIAYINNYNQIHYKATLVGADTQTFISSCIDKTTIPYYRGNITTQNLLNTVTADAISGDTLFISVSGLSISGQTFNQGSPYLFNGTIWEEQFDITSENASAFIAIAKDASLSSQLNSDSFTTFRNIITNTAVIAQLFSENITMTGNGVIQSGNYSEINEIPTNGYKLVGNPENGKPNIKAFGMLASNINIIGDSHFSGNIDCPQIKTFAQTSPQQATTVAQSGEAWNSSDIPLTANNIYRNDSGIGSFNGSTVYRAVKVTSETAIYDNGQTISQTSLPCNTGYTTVATIVANSTMTLSGYRPQNHGGVSVTEYVHPLMEIVRVNNGVETVIQSFERSSAYNDATQLQYSASFSVYSGDVIKIKLTVGSYTAKTNGSYAGTVSSSTFAMNGFSVGLWLFTSAWNIVSGLQTERLQLTTPSVDSNNYKYYQKVNGFVNYPPASPLGTMYPLSNSSVVYYMGTQYTAVTITRVTTTRVILTLSTGLPLTLDTDSYYYLYGTLQIAGSSDGIETHSIVPAMNGATGVSTYDLGLGTKQWRTIYAQTINGNLSGNANTSTKWATGRNFYISDGTNTSIAVSVDGSGNVTLRLPTNIYGAVFN